MCLLAESDSAAAAAGQMGGSVDLKVVRRQDYKPLVYHVCHVDLEFELAAERTLVRSRMEIERLGQHKEALVLDGSAIELVSISLNGVPLDKSNYEVDDSALRVNESILSSSFVLEVVTYCFPARNTELSGLYASRNLLVTQCEAQGFRRMTYFIDRPDNLSTFRTALVGDREAYPVMLSNGNLLEQTELPEGRQRVVYEDPVPKPCYLFAIVVGPLAQLHDTFTYKSGPAKGKVVDLYVYAEEKYLVQLEWALQCISSSMQWDYEYMHRAYDLDRFAIVCVEDFNAGAMENKGLTIYNVSCVLAHKDLSSDARFERVNTVIGHEYFHNWSGNRVTVRDWFQITLKEGFTNLREQLYDEHCYNQAVSRISNVQYLKNHQFVEDASPLAHPIRPDQYVSIDNFYTLTVYEKGSEVIRMMRTIVGEEAFIKGTDHYFTKHDGQAVTTDDFVRSIEEATGVDLSAFEAWYSQKGTPEVEILAREYCPASKTFSLSVAQKIPPQDEDKTSMPFPIPIKFGLIGLKSHCNILPRGQSDVLVLSEQVQTFVIENVEEDAVPSLFRDFSAPVLVGNFLKDEELRFLLDYDDNHFVRWDAMQTMIRKEILAGLKPSTVTSPISPDFLQTVAKLVDTVTDRHFLAFLLSLPTPTSLLVYANHLVDPLVLQQRCEFLADAINEMIAPKMLQIFKELRAEELAAPWNCKQKDLARRALLVKAFMCITNPNCSELSLAEKEEMILNLFKDSNCYTLAQAAFCAGVRLPRDSKVRSEMIQKMYEKTCNDSVMLDEWFAIQLAETKFNTVENVQSLLQHPEFANTKNPNRFRAVAGSFVRNLRLLHQMDQRGYECARDFVISFDAVNPYSTASVCKELVKINKYTEEIQSKIKKVLAEIKASKPSKGILEIISSVGI